MDDVVKARFLALYCMVLADGVIDANELETLYRIGREQYNITDIQIAEAIKEAGTSFILPDKITDKISLLYEMAQICVSDGSVDDTEINLLKRYALYMGFKDENVVGILDFLIAEAKEGHLESDVINKVLNDHE